MRTRRKKHVDEIDITDAANITDKDNVTDAVNVSDAFAQNDAADSTEASFVSADNLAFRGIQCCFRSG